ncbi:MAG: hypothetical protein IT438_14145 [Phycisphaerales bacterium]|nr:hypothetical protein [Phycisphaerales bacterium]
MRSWTTGAKAAGTRGCVCALGVLMGASMGAAQPVNDSCGGAVLIGFPSLTGGTTVGATSDVASSSCAFSPTDDLDVWYRFTAPSTGTFVFDTNDGAGLADTTLSIWSACPSAGGTELACDDDGGTNQRSRLAVGLDSGQSVRVRIAGWNHATGAFTLRVSGGNSTPANDLCDAATTVNAGSTVSGNNTGATGSPVSSCGAGDTTDVWYRLVAPITGTYLIETISPGTLADTTLAAYSACDPASELGCNDDAAVGEFRSSLNLLLFAGQACLVRVSGFAGATGSFTLRIGAPVPPPIIANDNCAGATVITQMPFFDSTTDLAWATDDADLAGCDNGESLAARHAVWYALTPAASGPYWFREGSPHGAFISVLAAATCAGPFTELGCSVSGAVVVPLVAGTRYFVLVGLGGLGTPAPPARANLSIEPVVPPSNDSWAGAIPLLVPSSGTYKSRGTTSDIGNSSCAFSPTDNLDVWFRFRPPATGVYRVDTLSTTGPFSDTTLSLWSACPLAGGVELFCNDDFGNFEQGGGRLSAINTTLVSTIEYYIRVSGWNHSFGDFTLSVQPGVTHDNETCAAAQHLPAGHHALQIDSSFALTEPMADQGSCNSLGATSVARSLWYKFVPGDGGTLGGGIDAFDHDMIVTLYIGTCAGLIERACIDAQPAVFSNVAVIPGANYYLCIGSYDTEPGGVISIDLTIPGLAPQTGACCRGAACETTTAAGCGGPYTHFAGVGAVCNAMPDNAGPCCRGDFNGAGGISVQDIFDYLRAYFQGQATANLSSPTVSVQDLFDFLSAYFAGCS